MAIVNPRCRASNTLISRISSCTAAGKNSCTITLQPTIMLPHRLRLMIACLRQFYVALSLLRHNGYSTDRSGRSLFRIGSSTSRQIRISGLVLKLDLHGRSNDAQVSSANCVCGGLCHVTAVKTSI